MDLKNGKITFFIATLCSGGAERVVSILSNELVNRGYEVEVLMYFNEPVFYPINDRVEVSSVMDQTKSKNLFRNIVWLRSHFRNNASIVVSFLAKFNMVALVATLFTGIPVIVSERTDPRRGSRLYRLIRDALYHISKHIIVQSQSGKAYFSKRLKSKMTVIYNPIDVKNYAGKALQTPKEKIVVSVGRLIPVKNQKMMILAFSNILHQFPDYKLIIYGEGECRGELEELIKYLGLEDHVLLPGNEKDIFRKLISAELFVLSSDFEGMPNALLEAMCVGLPVISTKVSGAVDVIEDGINGRLVEKNDAAQLASAIASILSDGSKRNQYAARAADIMDLVSVKRIIPQWTELIEEMINHA